MFFGGGVGGAGSARRPRSSHDPLGSEALIEARAATFSRMAFAKRICEVATDAAAGDAELSAA